MLTKTTDALLKCKLSQQKWFPSILFKIWKT